MKFKGGYIFFTLAFCIVAVAALIRSGAHLSEEHISYDGAVYVSLAKQFKSNPLNYNPNYIHSKLQKAFPNTPIPNYLYAPIFKHPPLYIWTLALLPHNFHIAAAVSILFGAASVGLVIWVARQSAPIQKNSPPLEGNIIALTSGLLLCIDPAHWTIGGKVLMDSFLTFWMTLSVVAYARVDRVRRGWIVAGSIIGLAMLTKMSAYIIIPILFLHELMEGAEMKRIQQFIKAVSIAGIMSLTWVSFNITVYQKTFFSEFIGVHVSATNNLFFSLAQLVIYFSIICLTGFFLLRKKYIGPTFKDRISRLLRLVIFWVFSALLLAALVQPHTIQSLFQAFQPAVYPETSYSMEFFHGERRSYFFYIGKLIQLSPFYIAALPALIYGLISACKEHRIYALYTASVIFTFSIYGEYETRHILPAVPFLCYFAACGLVYLWKKIGMIRLKFYRVSLYITLAFYVLYAFGRTIDIGSTLAFGKVLFF